MIRTSASTVRILQSLYLRSFSKFTEHVVYQAQILLW